MTGDCDAIAVPCPFSASASRCEPAADVIRGCLFPAAFSSQIFGMGGSTCTQRVLITAFENEAPVEIQVRTDAHRRSGLSSGSGSSGSARRRMVLGAGSGHLDPTAAVALGLFGPMAVRCG